MLILMAAGAVSPFLPALRPHDDIMARNLLMYEKEVR